MNEEFNLLHKLEEMYENAFHREGAGKLYSKMWQRIKKEYDEEPDIVQVLWRLSIEELIFMMLVKKDKARYEQLKIIKKEILPKSKMNLDEFEKLEEYYSEYLTVFRKYLEDKQKMQ